MSTALAAEAVRRGIGAKLVAVAVAGLALAVGGAAFGLSRESTRRAEPARRGPA